MSRCGSNAARPSVGDVKVGAVSSTGSGAGGGGAPAGSRMSVRVADHGDAPPSALIPCTRQCQVPGAGTVPQLIAGDVGKPMNGEPNAGSSSSSTTQDGGPSGPRPTTTPAPP